MIMITDMRRSELKTNNQTSVKNELDSERRKWSIVITKLIYHLPIHGFQNLSGPI